MNTTACPVVSGVPSPCINICRMSESTGLCLGCWRSIDEISAWSRLPDEAKSEVCRLIAERKSCDPSLGRALMTQDYPAAALPQAIKFRNAEKEVRVVIGDADLP
ncbi:MAG: DUF1289 domain-containing protein [Leptothrix sp. (in: b-proteobacteria)]